MTTDERKQVSALTDELFKEIHGAQGYFYLSDGETFLTRAEFFARIRGRLRHGQEAVRIMQAFLRRHGELRKP